jgi:hypothetical protein
MILGASIVKSTSWRGINEEFTNVYHFDTSINTTSEQVADKLIEHERRFFAANVNFHRVLVWGPADGTKQENRMLVQRDLTGTGEAPVTKIMAKELCLIVQWDTGRVNTRGGKIYLRKYLHKGALAQDDEGAAKGNTALPPSAIAEANDYANYVKNLIGSTGASLCDKQGRKLPLATPAVVIPYAHTRQFRR